MKGGFRDASRRAARRGGRCGLLPVAALGKGAEVGGRETSVGILVKIIPGEGEEGGKGGAVCDEECGDRVGI
jgi:hypothetical protein